MKTHQIYLIILNWNGQKDTLECLKSVAGSKLKNLNLKTIVVDNGSTDDSVTAIGQKFSQVIILENRKNLGFSGGNNVGINHAIKNGADAVILLNNDTTIAVDTIQSLVTNARKHHFDLASPKIYFTAGREYHHNSYPKSQRGHVIWYAGGRIDWNNVIPSHLGVDEFDRGQYDKSKETEFATGCCLFVERRVIETIGVLDDTFTAYFEDTDFCIRALRAGFTIGYVAKSHLWHKNAGSSGGSGSKAQTDLVNQSRMIFAMRYAPWRAKLAIIKNKLLTHT